MIFCVLCWRCPVRLFGVLNILNLPPCARRQKTLFLQGTGRLLSWALTLVGVSALAHPIPPSAPTRPPGAGKRSTETLHSDVAPSNELILLPRGGGNESTRTCSDSRACRGLHRFPANLFVLYCTHQVPVSHPHPLFLYSDGETLLVYVFDICTNAPIWKRKWNLDISVIISLPVFLFTAYNHLKNYDKINVICLIMGSWNTVWNSALSAQWWVTATAVVVENQGMNNI